MTTHIRGTRIQSTDTCVTFGRFDGLHRGHRKVIEKTTAMKSRGLTPVLLSFDYDPACPLWEGSVIYTETEKAILLEAQGIDTLVSYPFTTETMAMKPEDFVNEVLLHRPDAKILVVGEHCRFGAGGKGNTTLLKELSTARGFELVICKTETEPFKPITAKEVREEIHRYRFERAAELLGQPFSIIGTVVHGKALGRTAALPTANIDYGKHKLLPPHGIYATLTRMDHRVLKGLSIIGLRPTVDNLPHATVETYLLDFDEDVYGRTMTLEVHARVRYIRKFRDLHEVKIQVEKDIESVRDHLDKLG